MAIRHGRAGQYGKTGAAQRYRRILFVLTVVAPLGFVAYGFAWGFTAARAEAPDLAVDAFAVCFASVSGFAVGLDDAGFTFFRGPGSPFFCLVSLAMQSRSVLSPPRGRLTALLVPSEAGSIRKER